MGTNMGNGAGCWPRVLRPLFWWLLLVLLLFGIRKHQRLMEQTRLNFTVTLAGQPMEAVTRLDRQSFFSGQNISLGEHTFVISSGKTETFATNFFSWYGPHDFGELKLKRSFGTLNVQANPPASIITITGPEFATLLTNSAGGTFAAPTDAYLVQAQYPHWSQSQNVTVYDNQSETCSFVPQLGALYLTCNKDGATYLLQSTDQTFTGNLPAVLTDVPAENYQLTVAYHQQHITKSVTIETGVTNEMPVQFVLGAARIESGPAGASVTTTNGNYLGRTPLELLDVPVQTAQLNLSLPGYEPVSVSVQFTADQTNFCRTNLITKSYQSDMQEARKSLASGDYNRATQITSEMLNSMPNDGIAQALQAEANQHLAAAHKQAVAATEAELERQAQLKLPREAFDAMCQQNADAGLFTAHELQTDQTAKVVASAITKIFSSEPSPFVLLSNDSPKPDIYEVAARQTFSLGILGGTERVCLLVVGQAKPNETQIFFKVLEYQIKTTLDASSLFNIKSNKQMIPVSADRIQMTDALRDQISKGIKLVTERIETAIEQAK